MSKGAEQAIAMIDTFYDNLAVDIDNDTTKKVGVVVSAIQALVPGSQAIQSIGETARFDAEKLHRKYSVELSKIIAVLRNL